MARTKQVARRSSAGVAPVKPPMTEEEIRADERMKLRAELRAEGMKDSDEVSDEETEKPAKPATEAQKLRKRELEVEIAEFTPLYNAKKEQRSVVDRELYEMRVTMNKKRKLQNELEVSCRKMKMKMEKLNQEYKRLKRLPGASEQETKEEDDETEGWERNEVDDEETEECWLLDDFLVR